jgi:hypothetical protein
MYTQCIYSPASAGFFVGTIRPNAENGRFNVRISLHELLHILN